MNEYEFKSLMDVGYKMLSDGATDEAVVSLLVENGIPERDAMPIVRQMVKRRQKSLQRTSFILGCGAILVALAILIVTYVQAAPGGIYIAPIGLFITGLYFLSRVEWPLNM